MGTGKVRGAITLNLHSHPRPARYATQYGHALEATVIRLLNNEETVGCGSLVRRLMVAEWLPPRFELPSKIKARAVIRCLGLSLTVTFAHATLWCVGSQSFD